MKQVIRSIVLLSLVLVVSACGDGGDSGSPVDPSNSEPDNGTRVDIVIDAGQTVVRKVSDELYSFTLYSVPSSMLAFTEPPDYRAYEIQTSGLKLWSKMYQTGAPNAVLSGRTGSGETFSTVIKMNQPTYDATARTISFEGAIVGTSPVPPERLENSSLMIDPTFWQWVKIIWHCADAVIDWIATAIAEEVDPLEVLDAIDATIECKDAIRDADWH